MKNIALTGFMGTGKSVVGRLLARELFMTFVDLDEVIEKEAGLSVKEIFRTLGEKRFRSLEKEALKSIVSGEMGGCTVLATGGGAVVDAANRALLREWGFIVCLTASVKTILQRTERGGKKRPLLAGEDREADVRKLLEERESAYRDCDMTLDTTQDSVSDVVRKIRLLIEEGV